MTPVEQAILAWCRANPKGYNLPCMREGPQHGPDKVCRVIECGRWDSPMVASGPDWESVARALGIAPCDAGAAGEAAASGVAPRPRSATTAREGQE